MSCTPSSTLGSGTRRWSSVTSFRLTVLLRPPTEGRSNGHHCERPEDANRRDGGHDATASVALEGRLVPVPAAHARDGGNGDAHHPGPRHDPRPVHLYGPDQRHRLLAGHRGPVVRASDG